MDGRYFHESVRRLRLFAGEAELTPEKVSEIIQPVVEAWRPMAVPNVRNVPVPTDSEFTLSGPALADLSARVRAVGMNLHRTGRKGIQYHNAFQRHLAVLAETFGCRGWTESAALFDDPERAAEEPPLQLAGRVDVIWAHKRVPVAVFEIDSTVKPRSFQKLKEAASPHKFWVYFGKDVWGFKTFLQKNDAGREIVAVIVPNTFVPSFGDEKLEGEGE